MSNRWMNYLPAYGALVVLLSGALVYSRFILCPKGSHGCQVHVPHINPDSINRGFAELDAHLAWAAALFVFLVVALATVAIAGWVYANAYRDASRSRKVGIIELATVAIVIVGVRVSMPGFGPFILEKTFLQPTVYSIFPAAGVRGRLRRGAGFQGSVCARTDLLDELQCPRAPLFSMTADVVRIISVSLIIGSASSAYSSYITRRITNGA